MYCGFFQIPSMRSVLMYSTGLFLIQFCIQILFGIEKYKKLDLTTQEGKQRLIDGFINAIYVYDDRITFTYNYKDGTETITLSELESAKSSDIKCVGAPKTRQGNSPAVFFRIMVLSCAARGFSDEWFSETGTVQMRRAKFSERARRERGVHRPMRCMW